MSIRRTGSRAERVGCVSSFVDENAFRVSAVPKLAGVVIKSTRDAAHISTYISSLVWMQVTQQVRVEDASKKKSEGKLSSFMRWRERGL